MRTGTGGKNVIKRSNDFETAYYSGEVEENKFLADAGYLHVLHSGGDAAPTGHEAQALIDRDAGTPGTGAAGAPDGQGHLESDPLTPTAGNSAGTQDVATPDSGDTLSGSAPAPASGADVQD